MRTIWIILPLLALALLITQAPNLLAQNGSGTRQPDEATGNTQPAEQPADADDKADEIDMAKVSYALGWELGNRIRQDFARQDIDFDVEQIVSGIKDALVEEKGEASAEQMQRTLEAFKRHLDRRAARKNETYLEQNAKREGVKVTESGLQYEVLREGEGNKPAKTDTVVVHYRGTLVDGNQFDSSYERGQPATFLLDRVIDGWTEGLQLMPVGSKYRFVIPYTLAYGEAGRPPVIPPRATLIFEVELLDIQE